MTGKAPVTYASDGKCVCFGGVMGALWTRVACWHNSCMFLVIQSIGLVVFFCEREDCYSATCDAWVTFVERSLRANTFEASL